MTGTALARTVALAAALTLSSQVRADPPSTEADNWFAEMRSALGPVKGGEIQDGAALQHDDRGVLAGYFSLRIEAVDAPQVPVAQKACSTALTGHNQRMLDTLLSRQYDIGLQSAVLLDPTSTDTPPDLQDNSNRAEVGLFRLTRTNGKCRPDRTYFHKYPEYRTPWRPVGASYGGSREVWVFFTPWARRMNDSSAIDGFWGGILGAANLVGPIGAVTNALFGAAKPGAAQSERRSMLQSAIGFAEVSDTPTPIVRKLRISNGASAATAPTLNFNWKLGDQAAPMFSASYRFSVEYKASVLLAGDYDKIPNLSDALRAEIIATARSGVTPEVGAVIENLAKQDELKTFDSACPPVMTAMKNAGLSLEDQSAAVYSVARNKFVEADIGKLECLRDFYVRAALKRWNVTITNPVPPSTAIDAGIAAQLVTNALTSPVKSSALLVNLDGNVLVGGDLNLLLGDKDTAATHAVAKTVASKTVIAALASRPPLKVFDLCLVSDVEDATPRILRFPDLSGIYTANDRIFGMPVADGSGHLWLMLVGLKGAIPGQGPIIDRIWVGASDAKELSSLKPLLASLGAKKDCPTPDLAPLLDLAATK